MTHASQVPQPRAAAADGGGFATKVPAVMTADLGDSAALLIVDLQEALDALGPERRNNPQAESNTARLLTAWRGSGRPVVHVQHISRDAGSPYRPGATGFDFKGETRPQAGEVVVQKEVDNAFHDTGLKPLLDDRGVRALVVTGVISNNTVGATVRGARDLGYEIYLVADATASMDVLDMVGRRWRAAEVQAVTLANLAGRYATVTDTDTVLAAL